jgi:PIN domain nuclease of toxin-antitoxin system
MQAEPERLSARSKRLIANGENELLLSAASAWEIAIKTALGKLRLPEPVADYVTSRMAEGGIRALPVEHAHALRVATLPAHHHDPFDRLLVAQAQIEDLPILTGDRQFRRYHVELIRA